LLVVSVVPLPAVAQEGGGQGVQHYDEALLSKPAYKVKVEIDVQVPMRDGVTSSVDIYRPVSRKRAPASVWSSGRGFMAPAAVPTSIRDNRRIVMLLTSDRKPTSTCRKCICAGLITGSKGSITV
jgi:hypothetical protein